MRCGIWPGVPRALATTQDLLASTTQAEQLLMPSKASMMIFVEIIESATVIAKKRQYRSHQGTDRA
ncbi:MAG: hypothetical protein R2941_04970 [Desulfobacterales bacterium]